jgi:hypothetical protein
VREVKTARPTQPSRGGGDEDFPRVPTQMFAKMIYSEQTLFYLVVLHDFYLTKQMPTAIKFYRKGAAFISLRILFSAIDVLESSAFFV